MKMRGVIGFENSVKKSIIFQAIMKQLKAIERIMKSLNIPTIF